MKDGAEAREDARMKRKKAERVTQCEGFATITSILRDDYAAVTNPFNESRLPTDYHLLLPVHLLIHSEKKNHQSKISPAPWHLGRLVGLEPVLQHPSHH